MHIREKKIFKFSILSRSDWPGVCNNHDPVSPITMTRRRQQLWPGAINTYKPAILVMINRQVLPLQAGWKSDEYFKTNIFKVGALEADSSGLFLTIFLYKRPMLANWLWSWPIDPDFSKEVSGSFLHSQSLNISTKGDLLWVHGHVSRNKW